MGFRKTSNRREWWTVLVRDNQDLLEELPSSALANEAAFRDYVTGGVHRDKRMAPSVSDISVEARLDLQKFMNEKAYFDMDVSSFENFSKAFGCDH